MAPPTPPKGFADLHTAYKTPVGTFLNIIGVVVDMMQPSRTRTGEYMFTFKMLDSRLQDAVYGSQGITIRFFKTSEEHLPKVRGVGDIVLLRNAKMNAFNSVPVIISNVQTGWQVFPAASIPNPSYSIAYQGTSRLPSLGAPSNIDKLSLEEQAYVIQLKADMSATLDRVPTGPQQNLSRKRDTAPAPDMGPPAKRARQSTFGPKFQLVKELRHLKYADICVQVVKKFSNQYSTCELYVTDYTENDVMFYYTPPEEETDRQRDGDEFGYHKPTKKAWPGPWGWNVLKVNAKDPHAQFANAHVSEGDYVLLRNIKPKIMPAEGAKLEGDMWPDDKTPEKVQVVRLTRHDVPEMQELLARKEKYWAKRQAMRPQAEEGPSKPSKAEKKRLRKQRQQEERANAAAAAAKVAERNKHVRCGNEEVAMMSVKDIVDPENVRHTNTLPDGRSYVLPFINAQYRMKAHVVDFHPKTLEDFAVPVLPDEDDGEPSPIDQMNWSGSSQKYEWYFSLLLEDAVPGQQTADKDASDGPNAATKARVWVHVRHEDAQFLFGNDIDDPSDLRSNPQLLARMREKLCILWGDLEETNNEEKASNRPFECCVCEYGIALDDDDPEKETAAFGYKKLFRMFGTTIL